MRRGFTLIEIVIVISIISIILIAVRGNIISAIRSSHWDIQSCTNTIQSYLQNYIHTALSHRGLNISGDKVFPYKYTLHMDTDNNQISEYYDDYNSQNYLISTITTCTENNITLSGTIQTISIAENTMFINTGAVTSGAILLHDCTQDCQQAAAIYIDSRNFAIDNFICSMSGSSYDCSG